MNPNQNQNQNPNQNQFENQDHDENLKDAIFGFYHQSIFVKSRTDSIVEKKEQENENDKNLIKQASINGLKRARCFVRENLKINDDFLENPFAKNE